jgi:hypothetical protein
MLYGLKQISFGSVFHRVMGFGYNIEGEYKEAVKFTIGILLALGGYLLPKKYWKQIEKKLKKIVFHF